MVSKIHKWAAVAVMVSAVGLVHAEVIEKPVNVPGAMVSVTVSDLHGFIDGVGTISSSVAPMDGAALKGMLGMQLGDPGLAGIAPGKGLSIVAIDENKAFLFVELNEAQSASYTMLLSQVGLQARYADGFLVASMDAAMLDEAVALIPAVKSTVLARRSPTMRVVAAPAWAYEQNKEDIDKAVQSLPMMMGMNMMQAPGVDPSSMAGTMQILEGEMRGLLSIVSQCDVVGIELDPRGGSLKISETLVPKSGSRVATLLNAPKVNQPHPKIQCGMMEDAAFKVDGMLYNPEALSSFVGEEMKLIMTEMGLASEKIEALDTNMQKWTALYNGSFCESISLGGESVVEVNFILEIKEGIDVLALFRDMEKDMAPFFELYENLGMPMSCSFKENAREYKGTPIHQFKVGITMPEEAMDSAGLGLDLSNMVYDVAIYDNLLLYSMGGTSIETMIDRVAAADFHPVPLQARSAYPDGGFYYCDIDIARYLSGISEIMPKDPDNPLPQIAGMLQGAAPVTSAGFTEDGMLMWSFNVSGSLIGRIGQAVMMMQMQQMQQMQPLPGGMPGAMPTPPDSVPGSISF